jgi:hypothetical protein
MLQESHVKKRTEFSIEFDSMEVIDENILNRVLAIKIWLV